jgi:hypothetical protein
MVSKAEITDVRLLTVENHMLNVLTVSKNQLRLWEVSKLSERSGWKLKRDWKGETKLWYGLGDRTYALITSSDGAELYHMGAWDKPVLTGSDGIPAGIQSIWNITSPSKGSKACGFAVQYKGGAGTVSDTKQWKLFFTKNGTDWSALAAPSLPAVVTDFARLGPGEIAVAGAGPADEGRPEWHFYELDERAEWKNTQLPDLPTSIHAVVTFDFPQGFGVQATAAGQEQDQAEWHWFYRNPQGHWVEIHKIIPTAPLKIRAVKPFGKQHILAIQEEGMPHLEWHYFYHEDNGSWVPIQKVLPQIPPDIFELKTFAGERGIAFQAFLNSEIGQRALDWTAYYRLDSGKWVAVQNLLPGCPSKIWDIASFGEDRGIGIQDFTSSGKDGYLYGWTWFIRNGTAVWMPAEKVLPAAPRRIWRINSQALDDGLSVQADEDSGSGTELFQWSWFLPRQRDRWIEVGNLLKLPGNAVDRASRWSVSLPDSSDDNWRRGVLAVTNTTGRTLWFLRDDQGAWFSIDDLSRTASE